MTDTEQKKTEVVTVAVITYHSEATIIETLDSILAQTYGSENIELVISDDGSKDNTIQVIESWLAQYKNYFHNVTIIANETNGGISKNCNLAWKASHTEWIKTIAGDDILANECISMNMAYVLANPDSFVIFSKMAHFVSSTDKIVNITPLESQINFFGLSYKLQYKYLLRHSFNIAPTSFINTQVLKKINYCDERYKLIEDLPLWLKVTRAGFALSFFNNVTVFYRKSNSVSQSTTRLVNINFINQMIILHRNEIWPNLPKLSKWRVIDTTIQYNSWLISAKVFNNKRNILSVSLQRLISVFRPSFPLLLGMRLINSCRNKWMECKRRC